jgi:capsular exopolysaccharide synthesis family protein
LLGAVPELAEGIEIEKDKITHLQPSSPISENYRQIRTEILSLLPKDANLKAIVITSAEPQAGKTMTSANIAITMSQSGHKVMFVDADLRKPQLHKVFNLERQGGLSEYLTGRADLNSIIKEVGIENLKVVTSGKSVHNPAELIGSKKMEDFIAEAKGVFDFIILDSPPVISVTDAVILSGMADASIQVVRSGKILVPAARNAKEKLANTKAKFLGVVLNGMKAEHSDYGYYHYYKYYHYYGEEEQRRPPPKKKESLKEKLAAMLKDKSNNKTKVGI